MVDKKGKKLNDYKPTELDIAELLEIKSIVKKTNERVDALAELLGDLEAEVKEIKGKTYPGDIANAIREGFTTLASQSIARPTQGITQQTQDAPELDFDIFSVGWLQKNMAQAPANPQWGWTFGFTQDGAYRPETLELVKYLEKHGSYSVGDYTVTLGGNDNKLLRLNKKRT